MNGKKYVTICARRFQINGDVEDPYFLNLEGVVNSLAPLEAWCRINLSRNAIVFDVGANIGITALMFATLVPEGHVHVFEALPKNALFLRENIYNNKINNCTVNAIALGDYNGSIFMQGSGSSSHVAQSNVLGTVNRGGDIPIKTLDSYITENKIDEIDFMKIDVEGFEPAALAGSKALIENHRPIVFMEFNTWCLNFIHEFSAKSFLFAIWDAFYVTSINAEGKELQAGEGSAMRFLHDNVVLHGTVDDIILRLQEDGKVPLRDNILPPLNSEALTEQVMLLHKALAEIKHSISWRITAPLRSIYTSLILNRRIDR